jgi:hypothetical protein
VGVPVSAWNFRLAPSGNVVCSRLAALWDKHAVFILIGVQLALLFLPDPRGAFPVNDDWAYAHSVQWLLDEHRIRLSDWIAMNLLPQTLVGGAVSSMFGVSFTALRHVTQVASLVVVLALWQWFTAVGVARRDAVIATLTVMAVPCWPVLGDSFMTDVYGMLFGLPAATLFLRALRAPSPGVLVAATLLAALGVLQRQVVAVVPAAFLIAWFATQRSFRLPALAVGIAPLAITVSTEIVYHAYLALGPGVPEAQTYIQGRVLTAVLQLVRNENRYAEWVASNIATIASYLGLFVAPWALWRGTLLRGRQRWGLAGVAVVAAVALTAGWLPPYRDHQLITAAGIGPQLLYDGWPGTPPTADAAPGLLWRIAAIAAAYGLVALAVVAVSSCRQLVTEVRQRHGEPLYLVALIAAYLGPFVLTDYVDRYLLFVVPFLLPLFTAAPEAPITGAARVGAAAWIALVFAWGVAATHDYFAWNRARWDAIHLAEGLGATAESIDGGFEYNGYYRFEHKPRVTAAGKSWWWIADDRYTVAFSVPRGFAERKRFEVKRWLERTPPAVYLVERTGG